MEIYSIIILNLESQEKNKKMSFLIFPCVYGKRNSLVYGISFLFHSISFFGIVNLGYMVTFL